MLSISYFLDCIGSAFNAKGVMQCPNCRKIEKGNWLYANGSRAAHDVNMDEWAHDEDLYDVSYTDVVHDLVNLTLKLFVLVKNLDSSFFMLAICLFPLNFPVFQCCSL